MRLNRLDVLRAIAVFLVLGRHVYVTTLWWRNGWMGVDLFFVLSGFLVSGLLFSEQRKHGRVNVTRFWLRRAFKIYPPFYFLLLIAIVTGLHQAGALLPEALFYQNYRAGWWHHTWSLAVEEHFYVLLPLGLLLVTRFSSRKEEPFSRVPLAILAVAALTLALRIRAVLHAPANDPQFFFHYLCPTHLRIDSLAFGVLVSWAWHFRQSWFARLTRARILAIAAVSAALIVPCLFVPVENHAIMATVGVTALYTGFGGILVVALTWPGEAAPGPLARALGYVGRHSYSIYLWHLPVMVLVQRALPRAPDQLVFVIYSAISIVAGVALTRLIETPALLLRDRLLPSRPKVTEPALAEARKAS